ncbi:coiled-coil domain-containing protein 107 isoform X2 [Salmo trutta]|uniref:coiled-coil domain-containing protein 107 isoform X2 n=1 Tax=Salmo trutta TaxID=8032 RepID=UPI001130CB0D|nr:coiled-coil domain-containing protein 107-like isoform X2 [Salmo trutta]
MVFSSSQQVVVAFTAVLFAFVVFPRMFGVGSGAKETRGFDARYNRKAGPGPGPGAVRGQPVNKNTPGSMNNAQTLENMQQMKIKSADDSQAQKNKAAKGPKKSEETENQLTELEQRLAQTEKMLNSILTQLDPLTSCVKSVAQEQKNEIMSQLQSIRHLMKKRGMDCPPLNIEEPQCERNLDDLIESLAAHNDTSPEVVAPAEDDQSGVVKEEEPVHHQQHHPESKDEYSATDAEEEEDMPSLDDSCETNIEDIGLAQSIPEEMPTTGLRRRNRLE